jgi:hypothetical protein
MFVDQAQLRGLGTGLSEYIVVVLSSCEWVLDAF